MALGRTPVFFNVFGFDVGLITAACGGAFRWLPPGHSRRAGEAERPAGDQRSGHLHAGGPYRAGFRGPSRWASWRTASLCRLIEWTPRVFLQLLLPGLTTGCVYALVALGFVLCANVSGVVNFAQGEFVMLGGMAAAWLIGLQVPFALAILAATALRRRGRRGAGGAHAGAGAPQPHFHPDHHHGRLRRGAARHHADRRRQGCAEPAGLLRRRRVLPVRRDPAGAEPVGLGCHAAAAGRHLRVPATTPAPAARCAPARSTCRPRG